MKKPSRESKKSILKETITFGWVSLIAILLTYLLIRLSGFLTPDEGNSEWVHRTLITMTSSILDNIFAALVFSALAYYWRDSIIDVITKTSRIQSFSGIDGLSEKIGDALSQNKGKDLHITFLSPVLFSENISSRIKDTTAKSSESAANCAKIGAILSELVSSGDESYERVLVGKTSDEYLNGLNFDYIKKTYFTNQGKIPPTTGIGYHNNFNETAVFIICLQDKNIRSRAGEGLFMATAIFSNEYKTIIGYTTENKTLIREAISFNEQKFSEAMSCGQYYENHNISDEVPEKMKNDGVSVDDFCHDFERFFSVTGEGYQFVDRTAK